ncbi:MAG: ABC transporter substrate-binding protein [Chromatiales bacterium]|nr:MAG: ABC transporter substrate-binding protein [Chromatiales bacterium]
MAAEFFRDPGSSAAAQPRRAPRFLAWHQRSLLALTALLVVTAAVAQVKEIGPHDVVVSTANQVADSLDGRRAYFRDNPEELYSTIDKILQPNFDVRYAAYKVMGEANWKAASKQQRRLFVDTFYQFMLRSYASGLLRLDPDSLEILPDYKSNQKYAAVQTTIMQDTGQLIPVNYRLRRSKVGWRVYDVHIEGVSYVENYGNQFSAEIAALGLDAVIERLQDEIEQMSKEPRVQEAT